MTAATPIAASIADCNGNQYKLCEKLGKGGFAVCYRTEVNGQQILALKVSQTSGLAEKLRDKLITELQIHSKVRHANIVQFHRAFSVQDNTYITLELCTNGTLKEMLGNRGRISMPETRRFGLQLCGALHYLHSKRVIHRDIKTANILLDENMNIKLADFGLAAVLVTDEEMGEVKRRITVCGTPNYIAPEILHKKKGHDTKADIWSLGVLFYNMLTGRMPFSKPEDKGHDAVFKRVAEGAFSWPEDASKTLSQAALDMVNHMLQTVDKDRPEAVEVAHHDFFRLAPIPAKLDPCFVRSRPAWLKKADPQEMRLNSKTISHETMLAACGLDKGPGSRPPLAEIGQETETVRVANATPTPLSHLLLYEFNQGMVPVLPLRGIYEPLERTTQGVLKAKARKGLAAGKSTVNGKEIRKASSSRSSQDEIAPFLAASEGIVLGQDGVDLKRAAKNITNIMRGRSQEFGINAKGLPPRILHALGHQKWGLGYVLADGTVGLLTQRRGAEKAMMIYRAIQHFKSSSDPSKASNAPKDTPIHFYERIHQAPTSSPLPILNQVKHYTESTDRYPYMESTDSTAPTQYPLDWTSSDPMRHERARALSLWSRYAAYLAGKVRTEDINTAIPSPAPDTYLAMWQVIGNVQAWCWATDSAVQDQGGYEFQFADESKLALSLDGTEVRLTYPSGKEEQGTYWQRFETLELPLAICIGCSSTRNASIWRVLEEYCFRPKLEFIRDVLLMWAGNGGPGRHGTQKMAYRGPLLGQQQREDDLEILTYCDLIL